MFTPVATYRIQLHKEFTFAKLKAIIPYLHALGISTIYASPITTAGRGSTHGYDVIDPHRINPEIGTLEELREISALLKARGMSWLQDIVPNHMDCSTQNWRLMDVLERGTLSAFHPWFDIAWTHPGSPDKVTLPFLGEDLSTCINKGDIQISLTEEGFFIQCHDAYYPLSIPAYAHLLTLFSLLSGNTLSFDGLNGLLSGDKTTAQYSDWQGYKKAVFARDIIENRMHRQFEDWLRVINKDKELLIQILDRLHYKLANWRESNSVMNYRRFFTISSLICLRMEDRAVFEEYHRFLHQLYKEGIIQGLRIDHIDGLYDPEEYVKRLRNLFGEECYIIAEKILEGEEALPASWPLQGTSGYEFLADVSQLLTNRQGGAALSLFYQQLFPGIRSYNRQVWQNKQLILERYMVGEWDNLWHYFKDLELPIHPGQHAWKQAIAAYMCALPVYRTYPMTLPLPQADRLIMEEIFAIAKQLKPDVLPELEYLHELFCFPSPEKDKQKRILLFLKRLMQYTGPLMAKGVEDTTFYVYNPLIAHNEVGDSPATIGYTFGQFHARMSARLQSTPLALNATATHDTKRGEDNRLRINLLSEMPAQWQSQVQSWFALNAPLKSLVDGEEVPSRNDEYFIYQSILGGFPENAMVEDTYIKRLQEYVIKTIREAKVHSSWDENGDTYEQACLDFIYKLFQEDHAFLQQFLPFFKQVHAMAIIYSLAQLVVKFTAPGIADIYQGCELWDLSYVDPDNRRPVNYALREQYLQHLQTLDSHISHAASPDARAQAKAVLLQYLHKHQEQGMEKLFTTWKLLDFRNAHPLLFTEGEYIPLSQAGGATTTVSFARNYRDEWAVTVIPVNIANPDALGQGYIQLPPEAPLSWMGVLTGDPVMADEKGRLDLKDLQQSFAVGVWKAVV